MVTQKSPGGSTFPYYYKNGELFGWHMGSFGSDEEGFLKLLKAEEEFFAKSYRSLPLWIDFYETKLSERLLVEFMQSMMRLSPHITRLALVGCSFFEKRRFRKIEKAQGIVFPFPVRFYDDPEVAKTWLVGKIV